MKVGITGISSTLGSCLIPKLIEDPNIEQIIGLDVKELNFKRICENHNKIQFMKGDVRVLSDLRTAFKSVDVLIHMAFVVIGSIPDTKTIYDINFIGTKNVFNISAELGIKKIIYSSSIAAYGKNISNSEFLTEQSPILGHKITSFYYPYTKALVENFITDFEKKHPEINITIYRPHVIVGPQFLSYTNNFRYSFGQFISKRRVYWRIGQKNIGTSLTQFTDENDLVNAMHYAVLNPFPGVYNIAGEPFDISEVFCDLGKKVKYIPWWVVESLLKFCGIFSKKARNSSKWLMFSKNTLIMDCSKLLKSNYPNKLKSSKSITLSSLSHLKKKLKSHYTFKK